MSASLHVHTELIYLKCVRGEEMKCEIPQRKHRDIITNEILMGYDWITISWDINGLREIYALVDMSSVQNPCWLYTTHFLWDSHNLFLESCK